MEKREISSSGSVVRRSPLPQKSLSVLLAGVIILGTFSLHMDLQIGEMMQPGHLSSSELSLVPWRCLESRLKQDKL